MTRWEVWSEGESMQSAGWRSAGFAHRRGSAHSRDRHNTRHPVAHPRSDSQHRMTNARPPVTRALIPSSSAGDDDARHPQEYCTTSPWSTRVPGLRENNIYCLRPLRRHLGWKNIMAVLLTAHSAAWSAIWSCPTMCVGSELLIGRLKGVLP